MSASHDGRPRRQFRGSSRSAQPTQTSGTSHADTTASGRVTLTAPVTTARRNARGDGRQGPTRASRNTVARSEEHTSELQSRSDLVCRLLLEKKTNNRQPPSVND